MAVGRHFDVDSSLFSFGGVLRSRLGLALVVATTVVGLFALRFAYGLVVGDDVQPVTYVATSGGLVGGTVMSAVIGYGVDVDPGEYPTLRVVQWAHVTYAALAGAVFPRFYWLMAGEPSHYTALPEVLHAAHTYSIVLFTVAALGYTAFGTISSLRNNLRPWVGMMGLYLVYGVVLGAWMGVVWNLWNAIA